MGNYDVTVDVFDDKYYILSKYSDEELKKELERRINEEITVSVSQKKLELRLDSDISEHFNDILEDEYSDTELKDEIENRGYLVYDEDLVSEIPLTSKKDLAVALGLKSYATTEQIYNEIKFIINE